MKLGRQEVTGGEIVPSKAHPDPPHSLEVIKVQKLAKSAKFINFGTPKVPFTRLLA